MVAEKPSLSRIHLGENRCIELKLIQIGRILLCNHPHGIVHLQEITGLVTRVGRTTMPDFTTEKHDVPRIAQDTLFTPIIPLGCPVWGAPGEMTARPELRRSQRFIHIVEIVMGGSDEDWNFDAWLGTKISR